MIPQCVNDLCLDKVFEDYSSSVVDYVLISDKDEHIVDSSEVQICGFVTDTFGQKEEIEQKYFEVRNTSLKHLFASEKGIQERDHRK